MSTHLNRICIKLLHKCWPTCTLTASWLPGREMEIQQEQVHNDLAAYLPSLRSAVSAAVGAYSDQYSSGVRRVHSPRTRASAIHDHIVDNMAAFADLHDGVSLEETQNLWLLSLHNGYLLRFKKVGRSRIAAGHRTGQHKRFRNQQQLDGLPKAINLDLSYELDEVGALRAVYLICPSGSYSNMWDSEINTEGARPIVVSLFGTPPTDPEGATLLPKKRDKKDETQSGDGGSSA